MTQERYLGIRLSGGATPWFEVWFSDQPVPRGKREFFDSFKISHPNLKIAEQRWKKVVEQNICSSNDTELFDAVGQAIKKEITDDLLIGLEDKIKSN